MENEEITKEKLSEIGDKISNLKARLEFVEKRRKSRAKYILCILISMICSILCLYPIYDSNKYNYSIKVKEYLTIGIPITSFIGILIGFIICVIFYMYYEIIENRLQLYIARYDVKSIQKSIDDDDVFENSLKLSYKYLDQYYYQTREQAQKGFIVTVCVATFGAILIFCGIIAMFIGRLEPSYLTCASGIITEFIAAIFFYLYNKTVSSMSKYHNKLVFSQNISIALKVADSLPVEEQTKTKISLYQNF